MKSKLVSLLKLSLSIVLLCAAADAGAEYYIVDTPPCDSCFSSRIRFIFFPSLMVGFLLFTDTV